LIVLDASVVLGAVLGNDPAVAQIQRAARVGERLNAPQLIDLEVANALRGRVRGGLLSAERAEEALADLGVLRMTRYPHRPLIARIWELRENLTAYDAAYVALAETLGARLLTHDKALANTPSDAQVELVPG
jgi:predicted nucleic acid-binding protein